VKKFVDGAVSIGAILKNPDRHCRKVDMPSSWRKSMEQKCICGNGKRHVIFRSDLPIKIDDGC